MSNLSLITWNITADFMPHPSVPIWAERQDQVADLLSGLRPGVIGLQEMMPAQYQSLAARLVDYQAVIVNAATDDPAVLEPLRQHYGLEALPDPFELGLFYRVGELEALESGHWWLSPTPDRVSIGLGNKAPRAVQWMHARLCETGQQVLIFNTHIDHRCALAMSEVCRDQLEGFAARGLPMLLLGDFNARSGSEAVETLREAGWLNSRFALGIDESPALHPRHSDIDHILYYGDVTPQHWQQIALPDPQRPLSDHHPVYARFSI